MKTIGKIKVIDFADISQGFFLNGFYHYLAISKVFYQPFSLQTEHALGYPDHLCGAIFVEEGDIIQVVALTIHVLPMIIGKPFAF